MVLQDELGRQLCVFDKAAENEDENFVQIIGYFDWQDVGFGRLRTTLGRSVLRARITQIRRVKRARTLPRLRKTVHIPVPFNDLFGPLMHIVNLFYRLKPVLQDLNGRFGQELLGTECKQIGN